MKYQCFVQGYAFYFIFFYFYFIYLFFVFILDYKVSKPVLQFIGSVNDRRLVEKACRGVTSVFHLASIIDYSMFPDAEKMELVNVEG